MTTFQVSGKTYCVPADARDRFENYMRDFRQGESGLWRSGWQANEGKAKHGSAGHIPPNLRTVNFAVMLADYAERNWEAYLSN